MKHHTIELTYKDGKTEKGDKVIGAPDRLPLEVGDTLVFESSQGPVKVKVKAKGVFSRTLFHTGDGTPLVVKKVVKKFKYCCGVKVDGHWEGLPHHDRFGDNVQT